MLTAFEINLFLEARVSLSVAEQTQSHHQFGWVLKQVMLLYWASKSVSKKSAARAKRVDGCQRKAFGKRQNIWPL